MGLFDKIKHFAGGHGVTSQITRVERQDPASATFPVGDSVMKFNIRVSGEKEVTILKHDFEVWVARSTEDDARSEIIATETHNKDTNIIGSEVSWPYVLKPGEPVEDGCCIIDVDVKPALQKLGIQDLNDPGYRFYVKFTADVKGSPMDASAECNVRLIP